MYVQSLTLVDSFHIHLLKESVSVLTLNLILRCIPTSMMCDITTSSESIVVQYETCFYKDRRVDVIFTILTF